MYEIEGTEELYMIQPIDIKTQKFKKGLFGYKAIDVDSFIDSVYKAYDDLFNENAQLSKNLERVNSALQENRLKMFDLETKLQQLENVSSDGDDFEAKKKADQIIKNAEAAAASIIAKAKEQSEKLENSVKAEEPKTEVKTEQTTTASAGKESASSRFFKKTAEEAPASTNVTDDEDDEIFVGEIEDARKPDRMMIGDGEEEEDMDFEFL